MFLVAYTCSGLAGLIYQVSWTRLLTLTLGHTTAAASTVVAAFMGGLALGAFAGGRVAKGLSPTAAIRMYAALEASVALLALLVPYELGLLTPLLAWAYRQSSVLFPLVRVVCALVVMFIPAVALGATRPMHAAFLPSAVRMPEELTAANVASSWADGAGALAGPCLAGVLLATGGRSAAVIVFAVISALAAPLVAATGQPQETHADDLDEESDNVPGVFEAIRVVAAQPSTRTLTAFAGGAAAVEGAMDLLVVVLAAVGVLVLSGRVLPLAMAERAASLSEALSTVEGAPAATTPAALMGIGIYVGIAASTVIALFGMTIVIITGAGAAAVANADDDV